MNDAIKRHLISGATTFVATFLTVLGGQIASGTPMQFTWALVGSLVMVAVRAAFKAALETSTGASGDQA